MSGSLTSRIIILATLAAAVVGTADAAIAGDGDLLAVFVIVALLQMGLLVRSLLGRRTVRVRKDLANWLDEQSAITGEPIHRIADRCIANHRATLQRKG